MSGPRPLPLCYLGIAMHPMARQELERHYEITEDESRLPEAAAAIVYRVPAAWAYSDATRGIRALGCHSRDDDAARWAEAEGISLTLAKSLWRTVAEHTLALLMAAARSIPAADHAIRAGEWTDQRALKIRYAGWDFQNRTLGIWGMGQIGTELAGLVSGFRMRVLYNDLIRLPPEREAQLDVSYRSLEDLLAQSDYFCVLIPLNDQTRGALGRVQFAAMKRGCIVVNTARAGIINEEAFREALTDGTIGAAGLDVFWQEAREQPDYLVERENVVLTPHLGGSTYECDMALVRGVAAR